MRRLALIVVLAPLLVGFDLLQSPNRAVEDGNTRFKAGKAEEALAAYDKAVAALPADPGAHFDRGTALYALSRFDEANKEFLRATEARTSPLKAAAFYNLGNSFFKMENYAEAIAAYRRALLFDPNDIKAKWNLELALKKKKEQQDKEKQKKDQQSQKDKQDKNDKQDKQDKKDQDKQQQAKNDEQKKDQKQKQDQDEQKQAEQKQKEQQPEKSEDKKPEQKQAKSEPQPKPEKAPEMKEIEAVLDSLERSPKDLEQERARLRAVRRAAPVKDW